MVTLVDTEGEYRIERIRHHGNGANRSPDASPVGREVVWVERPSAEEQVIETSVDSRSGVRASRLSKGSHRVA